MGKSEYYKEKAGYLTMEEVENPPPENSESPSKFSDA